MAQQKRASSSRCSVKKGPPRHGGRGHRRRRAQVHATKRNLGAISRPAQGIPPRPRYHEADKECRRLVSHRGCRVPRTDGQIRVIDRITNIGALADGTAYAPRLLENRLNIVPYIKEAVVFGNGRDRVCALVDIDIAAVGRWADKKVSRTPATQTAPQRGSSRLIAECIAR